MSTTVLMASLLALSGSVETIEVSESELVARKVIALPGATGWDFYTQPNYPREDMTWPAFVAAFSEANGIPNTPRAHQRMQPGTWFIPYPKPAPIVSVTTTTTEVLPNKELAKDIMAEVATKTEAIESLTRDIQHLGNQVDQSTQKFEEAIKEADSKAETAQKQIEIQTDRIEQLENRNQELVAQINSLKQERSDAVAGFWWWIIMGVVLGMVLILTLACVILLTLLSKNERRFKETVEEKDKWRDAVKRHVYFISRRKDGSWSLGNPSSYHAYFRSPTNEDKVVVLREDGTYTETAPERVKKHLRDHTPPAHPQKEFADAGSED